MKTIMLWVLLLLAPWPAVARVDLFSVAVPVADDSPQARQAAMRTALQQVLERASGRSLQGRKAGPVLDHAEDLVQEFRYQDVPTGEAGGEPQRRLWVRFDPDGVGQALERLGLRLWQQDRPALLLWLALDPGGQGRRRLADPERDTTLLKAARAAAEGKGFELVIPLMDLADRQALQASDLWMGQVSAVQAASARYGEAVPLVGRLYPAGKRWKGRWLLLAPDGRREFERSATTPTGALERGLARATELLAQYAPPAQDEVPETVQLRLLGVHGLREFARVRQLLETLPGVEAATPVRARGDELLYQLAVRGGRTALERRLAQIPGLTPAVEIPEGDGAPAPLTLSYTLR